MTRDFARKVYISGQGSYDFIDKIYDSFEDRTCSNCRFYEKGDCLVIDGWDCYEDAPTNWTPPNKDFGCNKFIEKNTQ